MCCIPWLIHLTMHGISKTTLRLRQVDIKADHFERQTQNLERERDLWEKKYEVCHQIRLMPHVPYACMRPYESCYLIIHLPRHRKHKRNTKNRRRSSTSLLHLWNHFNFAYCGLTTTYHHILGSAYAVHTPTSIYFFD